MERGGASSSAWLENAVETAIGSLQCPLCLSLLVHPQTTSCGHTFCGTCLRRVGSSGDRARRAACPVCRAPIWPAGYRVNRALAAVLEALRPEEYRARAADVARELAGGGLLLRVLPLFVADGEPLLPGTVVTNYFFEPRYVHMLRAALALEMPAFGYLRRGDAVGCVAVVESHSVQPNGHFFVRSAAAVRFRILARDPHPLGFDSAHVELLPHDDVPGRIFLSPNWTPRAAASAVEADGSLDPASREDPMLERLTEAVLDRNITMLDWFNNPARMPLVHAERGRKNSLVAEEEEEKGGGALDPPQLRDAAEAVRSRLLRGVPADQMDMLELRIGVAPLNPHLFSFWAAAVLPLSPAQKSQILATPDSLGRLRTVGTLLDADPRLRPDVGLTRRAIAVRWLLVLTVFVVLWVIMQVDTSGH